MAVAASVRCSTSWPRTCGPAGAEPEVEMTFAGLHQLCAPFSDQLGHLPDPQRDALRIALNMQAGSLTAFRG